MLCLACIGLILDISAQNLPKAEIKESKHEVYAGLGLFNDNQMIALIGDVIGSVLTLGYDDSGNYIIHNLTNSTLLFFARPSSVPLSAKGEVCPFPAALRRSAAMPFSTNLSTTA